MRRWAGQCLRRFGNLCGIEAAAVGVAILHETKFSVTSDVPRQPRAVGALRLTAKQRGSQSVIADLRLQGSLKALFPRPAGNGLDAVFLNTAGGLTGGDRMRFDLGAAPGTHMVLSSQAAERAYRAQPGEMAQVDLSIDIGDAASLHWIPQETILFDGASLSRRMVVRMAPDARALLVEPVIFGRPAMGEVLRQVHLADQWRIWRGGELVFADAIRLSGDLSQMAARAAICGGAGAMATVLLAAHDAERHLDRLRAILPPGCGASLVADGVLIIRMLANDGYTLRKGLIPVIEHLGGAGLPKVWRL